MNEKKKPGTVKVPGFLLIALFFSFIAIFVQIPVYQRFVVEDTDSGRILLAEKLDSGQKFGISYIHSVNKSLVTDFFTFRESGELVLLESRFLSFGAGVETFPEGDSTYRDENSYMSYSGIDRVIADLVVFVGTVAEHRLILPEREILLKSIALPQTSLRFKRRTLSLMQLAFYNYRKGALHG